MNAPTQATKPAIEMRPVDSSSLQLVGYDPDSKTLAVVFHGKSTEYQYPEVDAADYDALINSPSIGRHFSIYIKNRPFRTFG